MLNHDVSYNSKNLSLHKVCPLIAPMTLSKTEITFLSTQYHLKLGLFEISWITICSLLHFYHDCLTLLSMYLHHLSGGAVIILFTMLYRVLFAECAIK